MNNILEIIKSAAIDSLIKNTIEEMHTMLNLEHEGGEEILKNFVKKGLSFGEKCKYVLLEKNGNTLDVLISCPGMEDLQYKNIADSSSISSDIFSLFVRYSKMAHLKDADINYKEYTRGKNRYAKTVIYPNRKMYDSLKKCKEERAGKRSDSEIHRIRFLLYLQHNR